MIKNWTREETKLFVSFIKDGMSITQIMQHFPECSYRQVEFKLGKLCVKYALKRPIPLRHPAGRCRANIKPHARVQVLPWDFHGDNIEVGCM